jgi:hypothetical protein
MDRRQHALDLLIAGLVQEVPPVGTPFSQARRECWVDAARAILAYMFDVPDVSIPTRQRSLVQRECPEPPY